MASDSTPKTDTDFPQSEIRSVQQLDAAAMRWRKERDVGLAAFTAVFDSNLSRVLLVQLGNYAKGPRGGNPWSLPGGAVDAGESPSQAACREVREETEVAIRPEQLRVAAWLSRPYLRKNPGGEVILLFAARADIDSPPCRSSPPEIMDARFVEFTLGQWLAVPDTGRGQHLLQPLRRHWIYWTLLARLALTEQAWSPHAWQYSQSQQMSQVPGIETSVQRTLASEERTSR